MSGRNDGSLLAMVERGLVLFLIDVLAPRVLLPLRAFLFPRGARLLELPSDDTGTLYKKTCSLTHKKYISHLNLLYPWHKGGQSFARNVVKLRDCRGLQITLQFFPSLKIGAGRARCARG